MTLGTWLVAKGPDGAIVSCILDIRHGYARHQTYCVTQHITVVQRQPSPHRLRNGELLKAISAKECPSCRWISKSPFVVKVKEMEVVMVVSGSEVNT